ncbi:MAG: hypothetical protein WBG86_14460 [Polyangiales bacterium]
MPQEIRVQRFTLVVLAGQTFANVGITIPLLDVTKAFVKLTGTQDYSPTPTLGTAVSQTVIQDSAVVSILSTTQVNVTFADPGTFKTITYEVWEYVGAPGGPNEFLVHGEETAGPVTGIGIVHINTGTAYSSLIETIAISRGLSWTQGGTTLSHSAGAIRANVEELFGFPITRLLRGLPAGSPDEPTFHWTTVEFTGSNWTVQKITMDAADGTPVATRDEPISDVGDWSNAFIHGTRTVNSGLSSNFGFVAWPGPDTTTLRVKYSNTAQVALPNFNLYVIHVVSNPHMRVYHNDSIDGTLPRIINGGDSGTPQTTTATFAFAGTPGDVAPVVGENAILVSAYCDDNFITPPSSNWNITATESAASFAAIATRYRDRATGDIAFQVIDFRMMVDGDLAAGAIDVDLAPGEGARTVERGLSGAIDMTLAPGEATRVRERTLSGSLDATLDPTVGARLRDALLSGAITLTYTTAQAGRVRDGQASALVIELNAGPWTATRIVEGGISNGQILVTAGRFIGNGVTTAQFGMILQPLDPSASIAVSEAELILALANAQAPLSVADAQATMAIVTAALDLQVVAANIALAVSQQTDLGPATGGSSMATVLDLCPIDLEVCVVRGDSTPFSFTLQTTAAVAIPITGWSFLLTVNRQEDPTDTADQLFQLTGLVTDGPNGVFQFSPLTTTFTVVGEFFADIQATDASANVRTLGKGKFTIEQDITK